MIELWNRWYEGYLLTFCDIEDSGRFPGGETPSLKSSNKDSKMIELWNRWYEGYLLTFCDIEDSWRFLVESRPSLKRCNKDSIMIDLLNRWYEGYLLLFCDMEDSGWFLEGITTSLKRPNKACKLKDLTNWINEGLIPPVKRHSILVAFSSMNCDIIWKKKKEIVWWRLSHQNNEGVFTAFSDLAFLWVFKLWIATP